jgi:hypothetical protein
VPLVALATEPFEHDQQLNKLYRSAKAQRQFGEPNVYLLYIRSCQETVGVLDGQHDEHSDMHLPPPEQGIVEAAIIFVYPPVRVALEDLKH